MSAGVHAAQPSKLASVCRHRYSFGRLFLVLFKSMMRANQRLQEKHVRARCLPAGRSSLNFAIVVLFISAARGHTQMPPILRAFELATHPRVLMVGIPVALVVSGCPKECGVQHLLLCSRSTRICCAKRVRHESDTLDRQRRKEQEHPQAVALGGRFPWHSPSREGARARI